MADQSRLSVYLIALGAFALGMASYVTAGLIPLIGDAFSVSSAKAAQLVTAFTLAYGLGSPVVVALLPGHHQRLGLLVALAVFIVANIASALATSFITLAIWRAIAGIGAGVYLAMGIAAAAAITPEAQRGKAIAIIMGGMASGTVLGVPISLLLAERLGWASAMWLIAVLGFIAYAGLQLKLPALPPAPMLSLVRKLAILKSPHAMGILAVSLLAAIASLGMYTFIAPFMAAAESGAVESITGYLWVWGIGGVVGSFLIGPLVDKFNGPVITLAIMLLLCIALIALPLSASIHPLLTLLPIALWGAVGWALQVPQNNELVRTRQAHGDGNLAVALNESALYLGSAIGAASGGILLAFHLPVSTLAVGAGAIAALGAFVQLALVVKAQH
ncbi:MULTISPECIES: MFS transporter [unclassified Halomonas]|uniref:MFS transporter n=1 Tax=unclassified Halomonas TaxID=2609666 RepID=UPI0007D8E694|nr:MULTISPECIES: MFS transporter [unclassified Halomonas]MBT2787039.1 MFS transporter [Halomonas sp. ISL-106]MBT2795381.1 MFS transporter [Halomonas sp. ISL-104]OAL57896.1 sugar transporter [Halomonas sp. ALS9]